MNSQRAAQEHYVATRTDAKENGRGLQARYQEELESSTDHQGGYGKFTYQGNMF